MPKVDRIKFFRRAKANKTADTHISESESDTDTDEMQEIVDKMSEMMAAIAMLQQKQEQMETHAPGALGAHNASNIGTMGDLFKIPDPIKSIPSYEGNRKQLQSWLTTAESTLNRFKPLVSDQIFEMYVTAVTNKITGKAKDILCLAGNPQNFDEIKEILSAALGDRQELSTYKCQLWQNRMQEHMSIHKYYNKTKEIVQNIKTIAKQNPKYQNHWDAINNFIDEDALAAFISGLRGNYFGHAQAARPKDIEDAYAFLCKFKSQEITASNMGESSNRGNQNKSFGNQKPFKNTQNNDQKSKFKPDSIFKKETETPEPMEIDPSLRSRLSFKKVVHNNETSQDPENSSDSDEEDEDESPEVNFCVTQQNKNTN